MRAPVYDRFMTAVVDRPVCGERDVGRGVDASGPQGVGGGPQPDGGGERRGLSQPPQHHHRPHHGARG